MSSIPKNTEDSTKIPTATGGESPTTVRPLDMSDDEDIQETGILTNDGTPNNAPSGEEAPPPKPPRPLSPMQQAEAILKDAFPSIDAAVVKAVLVASGGNVEPAFNALLGMSDPDATREPAPPVQPPRPSVQARQGAPMSQVEADAQYARQLAEHYDRQQAIGSRGSGQRGYRQENTSRSSDDDNRNFFDDDLPVIRENLRKGFAETQTKVTGWITNLKKKIDGDDEEESHQGFGSGSQNAPFGRRSGDNSRRSGDYNRYDADPQVLGDDFAGMHLNQDASQRRPLANPDLFKPNPSLPKSADSRKVSFQSNDHDDLYRSSPKVAAQVPTKQSKWQPLSNVAPSPMGDHDNDPFSLGDSEDEKESKDRVGGKEVKMEDTERLKKAAAEAMAGDIAEPSQKPEPAEISGTKDKLADEKLAGASS